MKKRKIKAAKPVVVLTEKQWNVVEQALLQWEETEQPPSQSESAQAILNSICLQLGK